jgi:hypothetical protein
MAYDAIRTALITPAESIRLGGAQQNGWDKKRRLFTINSDVRLGGCKWTGT